MSHQQCRPAVPRPVGRDRDTALTGDDQVTDEPVRDLREPDADRPSAAPGTPHPDPFLATRGWQTCEHGHGIYIRREPQRETDREAG